MTHTHYVKHVEIRYVTNSFCEECESWTPEFRELYLHHKRTLYLFIYFFYEWEHRTGTMCPFSSLHPLRKGKEV